MWISSLQFEGLWFVSEFMSLSFVVSDLGSDEGVLWWCWPRFWFAHGLAIFPLLVVATVSGGLGFVVWFVPLCVFVSLVLFNSLLGPCLCAFIVGWLGAVVELALYSVFCGLVYLFSCLLYAMPSLLDFRSGLLSCRLQFSVCCRLLGSVLVSTV